MDTLEQDEPDVSRKRLIALAHRRTDLAQERTMLAYVRTITNLLLFGIAFLGLMRMHFIFFYAGIGAILLAFIMLLFTVKSYLRHQEEVNKIARLVKNHMPFFLEDLLKEREK